MRKTLTTVMAGMLTATAAVFGVTEVLGGSVATAAGGEITYTVEDFNYPGASQIEAGTGAVLKRGNGHMIMTACDGGEDILIMSRKGLRDFCFNVTAKPAFLTLEIPQAYGIQTSADPVKTTIRADDGTTTIINAPANDFTGYGESGEVNGGATALIELRVS
ncbi:hypothetical protein [Streptomyces cyaneofuscatus]